MSSLHSAEDELLASIGGTLPVQSMPDPPTSTTSPYSTDALSEAWDFDARGGLFPLAEAAAATSFFSREGFVVIADVLAESENVRALAALAADLDEISPGAAPLADLAAAREEMLPTSPNHSFRTTCNIAFGRFAAAVRNAPGIRSAFGALHGVAPAALACSWDNPFFTPAAGSAAPPPEGAARARGLPLHWDANAFFGGAPAPRANEPCIQGVYYAAATGVDSPAFACSPGSQVLWRSFCNDDGNPAKMGARVLHYLPLSHFGDARAAALGLAPPIRVHVPARSLLLWDSRTAHGNAPPLTGARAALGRVAFAVCYSPVLQRNAVTHHEALLKGWVGVRTTHNPAIMLAHDRHGYPPGFVTFSEPNTALRAIRLKRSGIEEGDFQAMLARAGVPAALQLTLETAQQRAFNDYWGATGAHDGTFNELRKLTFSDLRALLHEEVSATQGVHEAEVTDTVLKD